MLLSRLILVLALAGACGAARPQAADASSTIYLGSVAMEVPAEMVKRLTPLTRYLSAHTGMEVAFRASPTMESAIAELGSGVTRIAYMTPVAYVEAHRRHGAQALVAPLTNGKSTFRLILAVKQSSPLHSTAQLKGRSFAFGDERARLQQAVVVGAGIGLAEFSHYAFLRHYDNIAKAVLNDDFDAGILTEGTFAMFAPRGLRALHTSPPLPSYLFAVHGALPAATADKLRAAFLSLNRGEPEHKAILQSLGAGYDGFATVQDSDYDLVRKLVAPFAQK